MLDSTKKSLDAVFDVAGSEDSTAIAPLPDIDISPEQEAALMEPEDDADDMEPVVPKLGPHVQTDFLKTRENLLKLIQQGESALLGAIGLATASEDPKTYEAVAKLMKELRETNKDIVGLHQQVMDMLEQQVELQKRQKQVAQQPIGPAHASGAPVVNNAVIFTGSPKELLDQINKTRK